MTAGFYPLTVAEIRRETRDAVSVRFEVPEALRRVFQFQPGQHVTLRRELDGAEVRRTYSVCAAPSDRELRVAIKQIDGGVFSAWVNRELAPGLSMDVMPPHGSFTWHFRAERRAHYAGFAGGSGITPILSLLKTMLVEEPQSRFTLFYGNRNSDTVMFLEELAGLKNRFMDRIEIFHFLDEEEEDITLFNGRLDTDRVRAVLNGLVDVAALKAAFICGPGPMMDAVETGLLEEGMPAERILIERFTAGRPSAAQTNAHLRAVTQSEGRRVSVTLEGRRRTVIFDPAHGNILDSVRESGLPAPYSCKAGVCATCRARLVSGEVHMDTQYGLTQEEVAQGYVLTCQSVPLTDVVLSYDA